MSYMRSPVYVWVGGWCPDDCPSMQMCPDCVDTGGGTSMCSSGTHPQCDRPDHEIIHLWPCRGHEDEGVGVLYDPDSYDRDGGINMPLALFDELVLMRYAELVKEGRVAETAARVEAGNFGSWDLMEALGDNPTEDFRHRMEEAKKKRDAQTT